MIHKIFSIYDSKANAYLPPFFLHEEGMAIRAFTDAINDKSHNFHKHPGDYTLFNIGTFNDNTSKIVTNDTPINLGIAQQFMAPSVPDAQLPLLKEENAP